MAERVSGGRAEREKEREIEAGKDKAGEQLLDNTAVLDHENQKTMKSPTKGKSCKGTLYYSSILKSKGSNPRCIGLSRTLQGVPSYIVSESEVEASKEGQSPTDFRYFCVGYSVFLDNKDASSTEQKPRAQLPVCVGIEVVVDKRAAAAAADQSPVHGHSKEDGYGFPQPRPHKPAHFVGEEFLSRFTRNASLVASGVARNLRKVGNYIKESLDDNPYRKRPK